MARKRIAIAFVCSLAAMAQTHTVTDAEVEQVHKSALLIDTHNDIPSFTVDGADIGKAPNLMTDIPRLRAGGVGGLFLSIYVAAKYAQDNQSAHRALMMIDTARHDIINRYPGTFEFAGSADEIEAIHQKGKIAALMGIEGGHAIENSLRLLRDYYNLGVRYMTLTHTNTNGWADSSGDMNKPGVQHHNGLNDLGKQVIAEMNRLGMMVDISHVADKTFWDALAVSTAPIIASHSSCRALNDVPRNMSDDMIVALAKKGGVVQINFYCSFLSPKTAAAMTEYEKTHKNLDEQGYMHAFASGAVPRATLDDVVAHIEHVIQIAGIDAVGIGSDFDGIECSPKGLDDVSKFPNLTRALLERGHSAEDIRKIYGGNLLRVMRAVEKAKAQ